MTYKLPQIGGESFMHSMLRLPREVYGRAAVGPTQTAAHLRPQRQITKRNKAAGPEIVAQARPRRTSLHDEV